MERVRNSARHEVSGVVTAVVIRCRGARDPRSACLLGCSKSPVPAEKQVIGVALRSLGRGRLALKSWSFRWFSCLRLDSREIDVIRRSRHFPQVGLRGPSDPFNGPPPQSRPPPLLSSQLRNLSLLSLLFLSSCCLSSLR